MKNPQRYRYLCVDWVGKSSTQSITLCDVKVGDALNVCGLGPEAIREFFSMIRAIDPFALKAKIEVLRDQAVKMDMRNRAHLN